MKKYIVTKEFPERDWKIGDIVLMDEKSFSRVIEYISIYNGETPHKHVAITVEPVKLTGNVNLK